jgi:predicted dehydrogenase
VATSAGNHPYAEAWWPTGHNIGYEHSFINQVADVAKLLGDEEPIVPLPDFADAWETQKVLEAVTRSATDGRTVKLAEIE